MANAHRGEVELKTDDKTYILKLGLNQMLAVEKETDPINGPRWLRFVLHQALISTEAQKELTIDDAGDLIDELGFDVVNDLIETTRWGKNVKRALVQAETEAKKKEVASERPPVAGTPGATSL